MTNIEICTRCDKREYPCGGECKCTLDRLPIEWHARNGLCKLNRLTVRDESAPSPSELEAMLTAQAYTADDMGKDGCNC